MTDVGLKASIDWDHVDTTDSTGELGSLINLARPRGFRVSAAADEIFEVEEKLTGRCVCHGTAAQVHGIDWASRRAGLFPCAAPWKMPSSWPRSVTGPRNSIPRCVSLNANVTIDRWPVVLADLFSVTRTGTRGAPRLRWVAGQQTIR